MRVWRLEKARHVPDALRGEGARLYGGRWNPVGRAAVYTAATLSLAALETLVHYDYDLAPPSLVGVEIDVPDTLSIESIPRLPADWQAVQAPASTVALGEQWLARRDACVLAVPSVIIPAEHNYILNPAHPAFPRVTVVRTEPFAFDPRLVT